MPVHSLCDVIDFITLNIFFLTFLDAELLRMELLHPRSPPEPELQLGGTVSTRGIKRGNERKEEMIDTKSP